MHGWMPDCQLAKLQHLWDSVQPMIVLRTITNESQERNRAQMQERTHRSRASGDFEGLMKQSIGVSKLWLKSNVLFI